ncbi:MAG: HAD family hydrolase [Anaerolineae bacterium]|nr:HAD family hydrolase [Anaerolineae bacterium]
MKIEAVVFDLGGTLIEYAGPYAVWPDLETPGLLAAYDYFQRKGMALPAFEQFRDTGFAILPGRWQGAVDGQRNLRLVDFIGEILHSCLGANGVQPTWLVEAGNAYQDAICSQAYLLPGTVAGLEAINGQYKLGLLSNTMFTGDAHISDLQRFGIDKYFDAMLYSADTAKWKPQPDPYLQVLADLAVDPAHAVFIGDAPAHDVAGAHAAGMKAILIRNSDRFPMVEGVVPDGVIYELTELPKLLMEWQRELD